MPAGAGRSDAASPRGATPGPHLLRARCHVPLAELPSRDTARATLRAAELGRCLAVEWDGDLEIRGGPVSEYRDRLYAEVAEQAMACIGCNDCLLACPLPDARQVSIGELNAAIHQPVIEQPNVIQFVTACTQCQQCVPACPADLSRARMVLLNKLKVDDAVEDYELMLQAHNVTIASGWTLNALSQNLTGLQLFMGTASGDLRRMLMKSTLRFLVPGEDLCREGTFLERLCVVLTGSLDQSAAGLHILSLAPGSFFGEAG